MNISKHFEWRSQDLQKSKREDEMSPSESYYVWFSAEGECELLPEDKSRVVNTGLLKRKRRKITHPHSVPYENETSYQV